MTAMRRLPLVFMAMCATCILCFWLDGGWNLRTSSLSPNGRYRVDLYSGARWQRAVYQIWFEDPGFATVTSLSNGRSLATSKVIELSDSPIRWVPEGVLVSTQTEFHYAAKHWD